MATLATVYSYDSQCLLAVEVVIWQLLRKGVLQPQPLAQELERHARLLGGQGKHLKVLARMVRYGDWSAEHWDLRDVMAHQSQNDEPR